MDKEFENKEAGILFDHEHKVVGRFRFSYLASKVACVEIEMFSTDTDEFYSAYAEAKGGTFDENKFNATREIIENMGIQLEELSPIFDCSLLLETAFGGYIMAT